jgi:hypothetical protein
MDYKHRYISLLAVVLVIFSCSSRPNIRIDFGDESDRVEEAMRVIGPAIDSAFNLTIDFETKDRFWGFHLTENRKIECNGIRVGELGRNTFEKIPGLQMLSASTLDELDQNFSFLFENGIRGVGPAIRTEFEYSAKKEYNQQDFFCVIFLNDGRYPERTEDEIDRQGNIILECRPRHRVLY